MITGLLLLAIVTDPVASCMAAVRNKDRDHQLAACAEKRKGLPESCRHALMLGRALHSERFLDTAGMGVYGWMDRAAHHCRKELHLPLDDEKNLSDDIREWLDRPL